MIMKHFDKLFVALVALLAIFTSVIGLAVYWVVWPYNPITIHSIEVLNADKTVEQGGTLAYHIKWTKHINGQGRVNRYFVNGKKHRFEADEDSNGTLVSAPAGSNEADVFLKVPDDAPPGHGKMQWTVTYPMNPIRNVTIGIDPPIFSDEFIVTAKEVKKGPKGDRGATGPTGKTGSGKGYSIFGDVKVGK